MKQLLTLALILMTTLALAGDEPDNTPRTPAAKGALAKLEQAREKARQEYQRAVAKAQDEAARELDQIKKQVMAKGDLDEANRIASAVENVVASGRSDSTLAGSVWEWNPKELGKDGWFRLNADGTVECGWHSKKGIWTKSGNGKVLLMISSGRLLHALNYADPNPSAVDENGERLPTKRVK